MGNPNAVHLKNRIAQTVTPAKAGIQKSLKKLDSRFRGNDSKGFDMRAAVLK